jgi:DNA polymerase-4
VDPTTPILHVDMDAFFASVEQRDRPELRGRPVLVGHAGPRGVVAAASYEARRYGCHSAQPMAVALRLCPDAAVVEPRGERYGEASRRMFALLETATPLVEPLSVDEAFLDVRGTERLLGGPVAVAERLRAAIRAELGLTASVGVAPNKFLAKLASDMHKPDGLTVIRPEDVDAVLLPLPVTRLWGVGPAFAGRLEALGVRTVADLRRFSEDDLVRRLGAGGAHVHALAWGRDDREVTPGHAAKSIGQEQTFPVDLDEPEAVLDVLRLQADAVAARLRAAGLEARTVTVKIRYGDFETITRSRTLEEPSDLTSEVHAAARALFQAWARSGYRPVRLVGVTASKLAPRGSEPTLFPDPARGRRRALDETIDRIRDRFGDDAIGRGGPS